MDDLPVLTITATEHGVREVSIICTDTGLDVARLYETLPPAFIAINRAIHEAQHEGESGTNHLPSDGSDCRDSSSVRLASQGRRADR